MMLGPLLLKDLKDFMAPEVRSLYSEVFTSKSKRCRGRYLVRRGH